MDSYIFANPRFSCGSPFEISHDLVLNVPILFSQRISVHLELNCIQNLNVMAPESLMHQSLLSVERCMDLRIVEPKSSLVLENHLLRNIV